MELKMPNGDIVNFPDDMPKSEIKKLIQSKFPDFMAGNVPPQPKIATGLGIQEDISDIIPGVKPLPEAITEPKVVEEDYDFDTMTMIKNIPESAVNVLSDIVDPIMHPIDTFNAIKNLEWEDVKKFAIDRYGSVDALKKTIETDPVGFVADAAGLVTGGAALAAKAPGQVGKIAVKAQKIAQAVEPVNIITSAPGDIISLAIPKGLPERVYEKAAKITTTIPIEKRKKIINTALDNQIALTQKGLKKLSAKQDVYNKNINDLIEKATASGKDIPVNALFTKLKSVRQTLGETYLDSVSDLKTIDKMAKTFGAQLKKLGKKKLTPKEVQAFKKDVYEKINFDRQKQRGSMIKEKTYKAFGQAARQAIEGVADVKDLNKNLGELIGLEKHLEKSVKRIENLNTFGIGAKTMAVGAIVSDVLATGGLATAGLTAYTALTSPANMSRLAIILRRLKNKGELHLLDNGPKLLLAELGLLNIERAAETQEQN